jgi:hypothetical protein
MKVSNFYLFLTFFLSILFETIFSDPFFIQLIGGLSNANNEGWAYPPSDLGDGGPAENATFNNPSGIWTDTTGNVFVASTDGSRIRKIDTSGYVSRFGGTGNYSEAGASGHFTAVSLSSPIRLHGNQNNLYFTDTLRVWKYNFQFDMVTVIAGSNVTGYEGDGGPANLARFGYCLGVFVTWDGYLFIADAGNNRIRVIDPSTNHITTFAGNGTAGLSGDNGPAVHATLSYPSGVYVDALGRVFIADTGNYRVRMVTSGTISTFAGSGPALEGTSGDDGLAVEATFVDPVDVTGDLSGNIYIADLEACQIRMVEPTMGKITTFLGQQGAIVCTEVTNTPLLAPGLIMGPSSLWMDIHGTLFFTQDDMTIVKVGPIVTSSPSVTPTSSTPTKAPMLIPTRVPTFTPTVTPTFQPTFQPTTRPTWLPSTLSPSRLPTSQPTRQPSSQPSSQPSRQPTNRPTRQPSSRPTDRPTSDPSNQPSTQPTRTPSSQPSSRPTEQPTSQPSSQPSVTLFSTHVSTFF